MAEVDVGTEQWLELLTLTTVYMTAVEELVDGLQGKLGVNTLEEGAREKAKQEALRRTENYSAARSALIRYARKMDRILQ